MSKHGAAFSNVIYMKSNGASKWIMMFIIIVVVIIWPVQDHRAEEKPVPCEGVPYHVNFPAVSTLTVWPIMAPKREVPLQNCSAVVIPSSQWENDERTCLQGQKKKKALPANCWRACHVGETATTEQFAHNQGYRSVGCWGRGRRTLLAKPVVTPSKHVETCYLLSMTDVGSFSSYPVIMLLREYKWKREFWGRPPN